MDLRRAPVAQHDIGNSLTTDNDAISQVGPIAASPNIHVPGRTCKAQEGLVQNTEPDSVISFSAIGGYCASTGPKQCLTWLWVWPRAGG
jgi:hypothetical protein